MRLMSRSTERSIQPLYLFMIGKIGLGLVNSDYWLIFMLKKWWKPNEKKIKQNIDLPPSNFQEIQRSKFVYFLHPAMLGWKG